MINIQASLHPYYIGREKLIYLILPLLFHNKTFSSVTFMIVGIQDIKEPFNGFSHESRSTHRTPNFTNPEFQFPQFKVLQSVFSL